MQNWTDVATIEPAVAELRRTFLATHKTRALAWRKEQLTQLGFMIQDNEERFVAAVEADLGRPAFETRVAELEYLKGEINHALRHLDQWAKPRSVKTEGIWHLTEAKMCPEPKGNALVIGSWNYPISLLLGPFIGAVAAGCTAILKPSESAVHVAELIAELVPKYLDPTAYKVVTGGVAQTTKLLSLRFDHIFYTGSGSVGRIVAHAAAEQLCSVTLELGGKSPCIVLDDANVAVAGRRIAWSRWVNASQTCLVPDWIVCSKAMQPKIVRAIKDALAEFSSVEKGAKSVSALTDSGYAKIVNSNHFDRLQKLLAGTKGTIVAGGKTDEATHKMEITVVSDVQADDILMSSEIFGPIIPVLVLESMEEIIEFINARDIPLALYVFTSKNAHRDYIFQRTRSGSFVHNDLIVQFAIPGLEFGGAGHSGTGAYHQKKSFDAFSHFRASASVPIYLEPLLASRYPPYTAGKLKLMILATGAVINGRPGTPKGFPLARVLQLAALVAAAVAGYKKFGGA